MTVKAWNVSAAASEEELMDILFSAGAGIKTQVLNSAVLKESKHQKLKARLSEIADELVGMQQDVKMPSWKIED